VIPVGGKKMEIKCVGLFVNNMETMVTFYRDIIGLKTKWNGRKNAITGQWK
jgi:catechol-2,3-dioxygenase